MEKAILKVIKIGMFEHMESFLNNGEMFFDTVTAFKKKDSNQERYDELEGADEIKQINWIKIQAKNGEIFELSKSNPKLIKLSSAFLLTEYDAIKGNIYSCCVVTPDTIGSFKKLDPRFKKFGDTLVLIENPKVFFDRVEKELLRRNFEFEIGLISYYNPKKEEIPLSIYNKKSSLSYQNEARIWIKSTLSSPFKIHIGSIKDIAVKFRLDDLIKVQKYEA
jgi:hypothetical protein